MRFGWSFNPRPRTGSDSASLDRISTEVGFNPRPRTGSDAADRAAIRTSPCFNPRPRTGSDQVHRRGRWPHGRFNPRPRTGSDRLFLADCRNKQNRAGSANRVVPLPRRAKRFLRDDDVSTMSRSQGVREQGRFFRHAWGSRFRRAVGRAAVAGGVSAGPTRHCRPVIGPAPACTRRRRTPCYDRASRRPGLRSGGRHSRRGFYPSDRAAGYRRVPPPSNRWGRAAIWCSCAGSEPARVSGRAPRLALACLTRARPRALVRPPQKARYMATASAPETVEVSHAAQAARPARPLVTIQAGAQVKIPVKKPPQAASAARRMNIGYPGKAMSN